MKVCKYCPGLKPPEQFPKLPCGERSYVCYACRDNPPAPAYDYAGRLDALRRATEWVSASELVEACRIKATTANNRLVAAYKVGQLTRRKENKAWEYRRTPAGDAELAKMEQWARSTPVVKKPAAPAPPKKHDHRPHFAWLDLCADSRPNYSDNKRHVRDTSGQRSFVI